METESGIYISWPSLYLTSLSHSKFDIRIFFPAKKLSELLMAPGTKEGVRLFALFTLGELGCKRPDTYDNFDPM